MSNICIIPHILLYLQKTGKLTDFESFPLLLSMLLPIFPYILAPKATILGYLFAFTPNRL